MMIEYQKGKWLNSNFIITADDKGFNIPKEQDLFEVTLLGSGNHSITKEQFLKIIEAHNNVDKNRKNVSGRNAK